MELVSPLFLPIMKNMRNFLILILTAGLFISGCASLNGTSWILVNLKGRPVDSDPIITMYFENDMIHGLDGCNQYSAPVSAECGKIVYSGNISTTLMACPESTMQQAQAIAFSSIINQASAYRMDDDRLTLVDAWGRDLATFVRENNELGKSEWLATEYNNGRQAVVSPVNESSITAFFGAYGRLSGHAGCNTYITTYEVSGNIIKIAPPATTRKFCDEPSGLMEQERLFLQALEMAETYRIYNDHLELRAIDGTLAVKFVMGEKIH